MAKGWTQERLAEAVDVEPGTIWKYETGRLQIAVPMLRGIARALSVEFAWLLGVDPPALRKGEDELLRLWRSLGDTERRALLVVLRAIQPPR